MKKFFVSLMLSFSAIALSQHALAEPVAGKDFEVVSNVIPTDDASKIEVMEIFWYGCPHCYHMEKPIVPWIKKLPADVSFKHMPALPRADWAPMAKTFFAMESLGILGKFHGKLFDAIHKQRSLSPTNEKAAINWLTTVSGLDRVKVEQAFNSFSVNTNLKRAAQVFRASGATGVPSLVIDGKYITSGTMAGNNAQALKVADYIIDNIRKAKAKEAEAKK